MKRVLTMLLLGAALLGPRAALAFRQEAFVPSIFSDRRPWEAGHDLQTRGFGSRVALASLPGKDRLLLVGRKTTMQVFITKRTQFFRDGQAVPATELAEGQRVRTIYDVYGNTRIARRVDLIHPEEPVPPEEEQP